MELRDWEIIRRVAAGHSDVSLDVLEQAILSNADEAAFWFARVSRELARQRKDHDEFFSRASTPEDEHRRIENERWFPGFGWNPLNHLS